MTHLMIGCVSARQGCELQDTVAQRRLLGCVGDERDEYKDDGEKEGKTEILTVEDRGMNDYIAYPLRFNSPGAKSMVVTGQSDPTFASVLCEIAWSICPSQPFIKL
jgi:hypothetical protein